MSNYEYIRELPLEEMAKEIVSLPICTICKQKDGYGCGEKSDCSIPAAEWLESERETEVVQNGG